MQSLSHDRHLSSPTMPLAQPQPGAAAAGGAGRARPAGLSAALSEAKTQPSPVTALAAPATAVPTAASVLQRKPIGVSCARHVCAWWLLIVCCAGGGALRGKFGAAKVSADTFSEMKERAATQPVAAPVSHGVTCSLLLS